MRGNLRIGRCHRLRFRCFFQRTAWVEVSAAMAFEDKELGDERLAQVAGGRSMSGYIEHTVCRGETLASIAAKYHVTVRELTDLNGPANVRILFLGKILRVPVNIRWG